MEDARLYWPGSKTLYEANKYLKTKGFIAAELYEKILRDYQRLEAELAEEKRKHNELKISFDRTIDREDALRTKLIKCEKKYNECFVDMTKHLEAERTESMSLRARIDIIERELAECQKERNNLKNVDNQWQLWNVALSKEVTEVIEERNSLHAKVEEIEKQSLDFSSAATPSYDVKGLFDRIEELEKERDKAVELLSVKYTDINRDGKTILDFMNTWIEHANDRISRLKNECAKWKKDFIDKCAKIAVMETESEYFINRCKQLEKVLKSCPHCTQTIQHG